MERIKLGNIYWLKTENDIAHPHVVIKLDHEKVTVCAITTNAKKVNMPGNVVLDLGEGNLDKQSIVEVSKVITLDESQLTQLIGTLSEHRVIEILKGIRFLENTYFNS